MRITWLGWAGAEIEAEGETVVIDPLGDSSAVFAPLGDAADGAELPRVAAPQAEGSAVAGLVTHLHRDHADAGVLGRALAPDATVLHPSGPGGRDRENLGLAQAEAELSAGGVARREVEPWHALEAGAFSIIALPAVDGLGDPQVSWLVEADGRRIVHLGDTLLHGYWWRIALRHGPVDLALVPINGAVVDFPHRRPPSPLPAVMGPEEAALAGELLGARTVVPIHYAGFALEPFYRPVADAEERFLRAARGRPYEPHVLEVGEALELEGAAALPG